MQAEVVAACQSADAVVMAAAPADFRPDAFVDAKIKKTEDGAAPEIRLAQTPDILAGLAHDRPNPRLVVVGFAAETGDESGTVMDHARAKLARKGCDLLVVNDVGGGKVFGAEENEAVVLGADGERHPGAPRLQGRAGARDLGPRDPPARRALVVRRCLFPLVQQCRRETPSHDEDSRLGWRFPPTM